MTDDDPLDEILQWYKDNPDELQFVTERCMPTFGDTFKKMVDDHNGQEQDEPEDNA